MNAGIETRVSQGRTESDRSCVLQLGLAEAESLVDGTSPGERRCPRLGYEKRTVTHAELHRRIYMAGR